MAQSDDDRPQHNRRQTLGRPPRRHGHQRKSRPGGRHPSPHQIHPVFVLLAREPAPGERLRHGQGQSGPLGDNRHVGPPRRHRPGDGNVRLDGEPRLRNGPRRDRVDATVTAGRLGTVLRLHDTGGAAERTRRGRVPDGFANAPGPAADGDRFVGRREPREDTARGEAAGEEAAQGGRGGGGGQAGTSLPAVRARLVRHA